MANILITSDIIHKLECINIIKYGCFNYIRCDNICFNCKKTNIYSPILQLGNYSLCIYCVVHIYKNNRKKIDVVDIIEDITPDKYTVDMHIC